MMNEEDFEDLFNQSFQNIFGDEDNEIILKKLEKKASSFNDVEEIIAYMNSVLEKVSNINKGKALEILFRNLKVETLEENFEELMNYINDYKRTDNWVYKSAIETIIKELPEEVKFQRFEELCDFILDEENKMNSYTKLSLILDNLPVNFQNPDSYKKILEATQDFEIDYYKNNLRKKIILGLPKEFILENYEEVSKNFFIANNISPAEFVGFAQRVFNIEDRTAIERLDEIFSLFKSQLESNADTYTKEQVYNSIIEYLPINVSQQHAEELLVFIDAEKYPIFWNMGEDGQVDNDWLRENLRLLVDSIRIKNKYKYIFESKHMELIKQLPESFIKENGIECFSAFTGYNYKELTRIVFNEPENSNYENLKNTIVWLGENSLEKLNGLDYKKKEIFEIITDALPTDFVQANLEVLANTFYLGNFEKLYAKIFKIEDSEELDTELFLKNLSITANFIKSKTNYNHIITEEYRKILEYLPNELIEKNLEFCINIFNIENFEDLYAKVLSPKENEELNNDLVAERINIFLEHLEKQNLESYILKDEHRKIIEVLPKEFVKNNIEFCMSKFDKSLYFKLLPKCFSDDETEKIDIEEAKKILEKIKQKTDEKFDYGNIFERREADNCWNEIIAKLPKEFIKENSEYLISLLDKKIPEKSKIYFLQNIPEDVINKYEEKLITKISIENIGVYQRYLDYLTSNSEQSLIKSSIGIQILDFINLNSNNDTPEFLKIKELFDKEKSKYENLDMGKYSRYLPENYSELHISMDKATFEEFLGDLEKIKFLKGNIPEEYCDYIIKQKLTENSILNQDLDKHLPMLKRIFEEKVKHLLLKDGLDGYTIEFFENDGVTLGYHNKTTKTIGFLEDNLINLNATNTHIINTAYHEIKHGIQAKHYKTTDFSKLNGSLYNMIKEEIIRDEDKLFYDRNYTRMYCEIDARLAGTRGQAEYLKFLGISEEQIIENVGSTAKTLKEIVETNKKEEQENTDYASNKVDKEGRIVSISQKASELIKKNPEWLKNYPVLSLEFDESGERKKTPEILSNAISCNNSSIQDIYLKIFENGISVSLEDSAETLEYISKLLETRNGYENDIVNYINLIIKNETFESLRDADINDIECKRVLSLLNKISTDNPNLEISKYIKEKLNVFSHEGKINVEMKKDSKLSDSAISTILKRDVKTEEDFETILRDLSKTIIDKDKSNFNLKHGFKNLFETYFKNDPTIDFNLLLEKTLEIVAEVDRKEVIENTWEAVPKELIQKHIKGFIDLNSKYGTVDFQFAYKTMAKIDSEEIKENPNLLNELFGEYLPQGMIPFLRRPKNRTELDDAIEEAQKNGGEYKDIDESIGQVIISEIQKENEASIEMLYSQMELKEGAYMKGGVITTFLIYASRRIPRKTHRRNIKTCITRKRIL